MKNMKKLLALLLAMVMLFALCACGDSKDDDKDDDKKEGTTQSDKNDDDDKKNDDDKNNDDEKDDEKDEKLTDAKLEGDWEATLDLDAIMQMMGEEEIALYDQMGIDLGKCTLDITFEDGEATLKADGMIDWYVDMMESVIDWCYEGDNMLEYLAVMMSEGDEELTTEDIEDMLEEEGVSIDDILDEYFGEVDLDAMADEMADELEDEVMDYELDGDEIIFDDDSVWTISYSNGKIYVLSVDGEDLSKGDFVLEKN